MKRLHPPLGRFFDPAVEAFADMMMENPFRSSHDLSLVVAEKTDKQPESKATITLPNGRVVEGYAIRRYKQLAQIELMHAMLATDIGAPSVPYIYFKDRDLMFSPAPFKDAKEYIEVLRERGWCLTRRDVMAGVPAETLGAIEPFTRWINKFDDYDQNRVYGTDGDVTHTAMIDNGAVSDFGYVRTETRKQIIDARAVCRFGQRGKAFHRARREMIRRISRYPVKRIRQLEATIQGGFLPCARQPMAKRAIGRRFIAAPLFGFF